VARCPQCDYFFDREEGFFLGAYVMNLGATQLAVVTYIAVAVVLTLPSPPLLELSLGGAAVAGLVPLLGYPISKTLWTAFDLIMHPAHLDQPDGAGRGGRESSEGDESPLGESAEFGGLDTSGRDGPQEAAGDH
jgi:hypothetical protein